MKDRQPPALSRRDFLKWVGVGVALGVGGEVFRGLLQEHNYTGEGNESYGLYGELLEGGEVVDETELVQMYLKKMVEEVPIYPDPTMIRSTIFNAMKFFGMDDETSSRRSKNISVSLCSEENTSCTHFYSYDTSSGLGVEINDGALDPKDGPTAWKNLLLALSHEAYHLSVRKVDDRKSIEDYGVLGIYESVKNKRGFFSSSEECLGEIDLINRDHFENVTRAKRFSLPEEFFAELGMLRYFDHLLSKGLENSSLVDKTKMTVGYPIFVQGLVDIQDTKGEDGSMSWKDWWGRALEFDHVDKLHRKNKRHTLYKGVGERILYHNASTKMWGLKGPDIAALGVVAFADFADYELSNRQVLNNLISFPLNPELIKNMASILHDRIAETQS